MATASSFLSEDQFLCSICLDVFTEPISTPCGHNFCQECIGRHWGDKEQCQCPMCNKKFSRGLKLNVNTGFKEIVENFKAHRALPLKPDEVPCDRCLGIKFKAIKTCLVCLESYCGTHLEPHQRDAALMSHKLTHPVKNLSDKICKKHNSFRDSFCRNDLAHFCARCAEHWGHDTVSLEDEYQQQKAGLQKQKADMEKMMLEREKKVREMEEYVESRRIDKEDARTKCVHTFSILVASIEMQLAKLGQAIEGKHKAAERQAEMLVKELKEEIGQLQTTSTKLERLLYIEDHFELIRSARSFSSSTLHTKNWSEVSIMSQHSVDAVRMALNQLEDTISKEMEEAAESFRTCCGKILHEEPMNKPEQPITDLASVPEGHRLEIIRQQYAVDMIYDPSSQSDMLIYSEDLKQVGTYDIVQLSNGPKQLCNYAFVLGNKGFSKGRFYFEVQAAKKTDWDVGVARQSLHQIQKFTDKFWSNTWLLRLRNKKNLKALHNSPVRLRFKSKPERIGVFVDYEEGLVSFYDVDTVTLIYSFIGCAFNERIFPYFSPCPHNEGSNEAPLVLTYSLPDPNRKLKPPITKTQQRPDDDFYNCYVIGILLVMFIGSIMKDSFGYA
ncbi:probable E3 ubiquitin-protein ligase TRIML1 [Dunckerocampus dactyliophorus]|uniref:probable E3 ubiquitin-protein ligase TRIML1 n=1 Tax=Dunckerocampus dactyliophorus TaxID=161453 RepID=UPI002405260E|nr:probable E3 ubiquitin-protein ligase TRIML1 [Dunckerocampus dactyliophorus]XP_054636775.1 probable E3 ubiquitin-protein ligase TRIML1 [Dunckerocampus dactyliophorus]XP_054636776.1 probable E3 ubiquitin-protein ligase TRIML1 [Dunckerocampus dactyliophorus]XP_054636777.1 probable E3 ubiquitin-protein ligase TRIML1 [Dunckerocampus dactyliophorus]XP_054636778.1 probable E3 ubiquitin-protein ligase TRIML1 [Dunckerocampus dactyliophorus]XP_054636779.1 probable E3 ubiquitin-protein ligase TRIML1 [